MVSAARTTGVVYERRRPERTTLYEVVRDNVETLYGANDDGAIAIRIPKHAKKELEAYLDGAPETRRVPWSWPRARLRRRPTRPAIGRASPPRDGAEAGELVFAGITLVVRLIVARLSASRSR